MRKSLFTEAQVIGILKRAEAGQPVTELCCELGNHAADGSIAGDGSLRDGGLDAQELNRLFDENRRLETLWSRSCRSTTGFSADARKVIPPAAQRQSAASPDAAEGQPASSPPSAGLSRRACLSNAETDEPAAAWALRTRRSKSHATDNGGLHALLRRRGERVNKKRVHRLYCEGGTGTYGDRIDERSAVARGVCCCRAVGPISAGRLDFMQDSLEMDAKSGCSTSSTTAPGSKSLYRGVDGFQGLYVTRVLERLCQQREAVLNDSQRQRTEFVLVDVQRWAQGRGIRWHHIEPGKPTQNSHRELQREVGRDASKTGNLVARHCRGATRNGAVQTQYNTERPHQVGISPVGVRTEASTSRKSARKKFLTCYAKPQDSLNPWIDLLGAGHFYDLIPSCRERGQPQESRLDAVVAKVHPSTGTIIRQMMLFPDL